LFSVSLHVSEPYNTLLLINAFVEICVLESRSYSKRGRTKLIHPWRSMIQSHGVQPAQYYPHWSAPRNIKCNANRGWSAV
jgi:hypothetical protein